MDTIETKSLKLLIFVLVLGFLCSCASLVVAEFANKYAQAHISLNEKGPPQSEGLALASAIVESAPLVEDFFQITSFLSGISFLWFGLILLERRD